jgi:hypothetical protein
MAVRGHKRRSAGDLAAAKRMLWSGIQEAVRIVEDPDTPEDRRLKAISCLSTAIGVYSHVLYDHEIDRRLSALEAAERNGAHA